MVSMETTRACGGELLRQDWVAQVPRWQGRASGFGTGFVIENCPRRDRQATTASIMRGVAVCSLRQRCGCSALCVGLCALAPDTQLRRAGQASPSCMVGDHDCIIVRLGDTLIAGAARFAFADVARQRGRCLSLHQLIHLGAPSQHCTVL